MKLVRYNNKTLAFDLKDGEVYIATDKDHIKQNFLNFGAELESFLNIKSEQMYFSKREDGGLLATYRCINLDNYTQFYFKKNINISKIPEHLKELYQDGFGNKDITLNELLSNN